MNYKRPIYSGMDERGNLLSRLRFSGYVRVWSVDERKKVSPGEPDKKYWVIKDEFGASFLCWEETIKSQLVVGEKYLLSGDIKVGKGSVFLVLQKVETLTKTEG